RLLGNASDRAGAAPVTGKQRAYLRRLNCRGDRRLACRILSIRQANHLSPRRNVPMNTRTPTRLAVLLSKSGTSLQNFLDRIADGRLNAEVVAVISNNANAFGL